MTKHEGGNEERKIGSVGPEEQLRILIDELNRQALRDELRPNEISLIRELLPQIREALEAQRRVRWLLKLIGMFLLAAPAVAAVGQGVQKILEWIRAQ